MKILKDKHLQIVLKSNSQVNVFISLVKYQTSALMLTLSFMRLSIRLMLIWYICFDDLAACVLTKRFIWDFFLLKKNNFVGKHEHSFEWGFWNMYCFGISFRALYKRTIPAPRHIDPWCENQRVNRLQVVSGGESALYKSARRTGSAPPGLFPAASQAGFTPATSAPAHPASKLENCDKAKHLNH